MNSKFTLIALFLQVGFLHSTTEQWINTTVNPAVWMVGVGGVTAYWTNGTIPGGAAGDEADFNSNLIPPPANPIINCAGSIIVGTIKIDSSTNYTINTAPTFSFSNTSGNPALIQIDASNGNGAHTLSGSVTLVSNLIINQGSTGTFTMSGGTISSSSTTQTITKTGTGRLVFSGANSYSGGTIIQAGTLSIGADNNLGLAGSTVTISAGTLEFTNTFATSRPFSLTGSASINITTGNSATLSGLVSGSGSLTKSDAGSLILQGTNTYQGGTDITAGALHISSDNNLGNASGPLTIGSATLVTTAAVTSSRSGSFTGAAIINTNGNSDTFTGNFSGSGSLEISSGTVTLTGNNSYSGGTTVDNATTLAGTTNGIQGNITLNTNSSLLNFSQNFDGTYSGVLTSAVANAGQLTKLGSGTVTISKASPAFSGTTAINQGILSVSGSIANSPITVASGATLNGAGTVGSTTNNGTIDPGNGVSAIGSLNVNGTLTLNPSSTVNIDLAPTSSDQILTTGAATLSGSLLINPTPGFYGFTRNYTILTSTALTPGFSSIASTNSNFVPTISYTATDVILDVDILAPFATFPFSNFNTEAVGNNIDAIYTSNQLSPDLFNIFNSFVGTTFSLINNALDQMHPAPYSAFTEMQSEVSGQLLSLFHRLPYLSCCCSKPNRIWLEPFGNSLTMKPHEIQFGFQGNSGGIAFGYDGQISENLILGVGGAWNKNWLHWHHNHGHGESNGLFGSLYFDSQFGNFYLGGSFLGGVDFYHTSRHIEFLTTNRHATAHYQALDLMGQIATAYLFGSPQAFFYPYANFDYLYLHTGQIKEKGAGGLNLKVQKHTDATFRTEIGLGLQVQDRNAAETMCISPLFSIGWVNMCPLQRPLLTATFEGATIPFSARGWKETWNLFNVNFGLTIAYRCYSLALQYNAEISPNHQTTLFNQHGNARLDWKW
jgi:autotransporter-associated beta strand protein